MSRRTGTLQTFAAVSLAAVSLAAGCDTTEGTVVDARGGEVTSDDGRVTLQIPAGALVDEVEIQIVESEVLPEGAIGPSYEIEPLGLTFSYPAHLAYSVTEGMKVDPKDARLIVAREEAWSMLADRNVDMQQLEVTASLLYASTIAIVE